MKYQKVIASSLVIIVIGVALYYVISNRTSLFNSVAKTDLQTQSVTIGTVTYKVTPKTITRSATTWDFEVTLDTHTGSLDQDLVAIVRLVDDKGREYKAIKWEGDPPGGHHRKGTLSFQPIDLKPKKIILQIEERKFEWKLEGR